MPLAKARLPSRVIVNFWEEYGKTQPFLLETNDQIQETFATLSYRWSDEARIKTTRLTLDSHLQALDIGAHNGTNTFFDAVSVCRAMGIPFLWIDALCIIQHDPDDPLSNHDDWAKEAKDMGPIYAESALTIAATGASDDPLNGLFGDRSSLAQYVELPFRLNMTDEPDGAFVVSLLPQGLDSEVSKSILYTRGWILQERLLSHRYLHFGKTQWFWQCRQSTVAEFSGFEDQETGTGAAFHDGDEYDYLDDCTKFIRRWMRIVEAYSRLDFDRFFAIQGLVNEGKAESGDENYYGMWSTMLYVQLFWWIDWSEEGTSLDPKVRTKRSSAPESQYHPSWSWMSTSQPVSYFKLLGGTDYYGTVPDIPVLKGYYKPSFLRPAFEHRFLERPSVAGNPGRTILVVDAAIERVVLDYVPIDQEYPPRPSKSSAVSKPPRWHGEMNRGDYHTKLKAAKGRGGWEGKVVGGCNLDNDAFRRVKSCYCLAVSGNWSKHGDDEDLLNVNVLIVWLYKKDNEVCARRLGIGCVTEKAWFEKWKRKSVVMQ
jgi:hypothetical protein